MISIVILELSYLDFPSDPLLSQLDYLTSMSIIICIRV